MDTRPFATNHPVELKLISDIVADLTSFEARTRYADWLKEQRDSRSEFVFQLAEFVRSISTSPELPKSDEFERCWTNMLGVPLFEAILAEDLVSFVSPICRLARPTLVIDTAQVPPNSIAVGGSKFGGLPDLPADVDWPQWTHGRMGFVGQLNLEDVAFAQASRAWPKAGVLSFFSYAFAMSPGDTRVLFYPSLDHLRSRVAPNDLGDDDPYKLNTVRPTCRLSYREWWDLPRKGDLLPKRLQADLSSIPHDRVWRISERLFESENGIWPKSRPGTGLHEFGGYQKCCRCDDPSPGSDWTTLASFSSDKNLDWNWCDGDRLTVYVHEDDVQDGSFRRTFGYAG